MSYAGLYDPDEKLAICERQLDAALAKLGSIRLLCDAQGEDSYVMVYALRAVLGEQP